MADTRVSWYSMDEKLKTQDHAAVPLKEAHDIVRRYHARGDERFGSAEAAVSATMFGFMRDEADFIEFCVNGRDRISFKFEWRNPEVTGFKRLLFGKLIQIERTLQSVDEMLARTTDFFTLPPSAFAEKLKNG